MNVISDYRTERGVLGEHEQAYISSLGPVEVVGEGGEFVTFRTENEPDFVYKVIRDKDSYWTSRGAKIGEDRIDNMVYAGKIGISPVAEKVDKGIVKQRYIANLDDAKLRTSLKNNDEEAVTYSLHGLKKWHEKGKSPGDTNTTNILDPRKTGGYVSVDTTGFHDNGYSGKHDLIRRTFQSFIVKPEVKEQQNFSSAVLTMFMVQKWSKTSKKRPKNRQNQ